MLLTSPTRQSLRRQNPFVHVYSVAQAALQALAGMVLHPAVLLAAVAFLLGGSHYQVAAFSVIAVAAWTLTPLLLQVLRPALSRAYPIVFLASLLRVFAAIVIGVVGWQVDEISTKRVVSWLVAAWLVHQVASAIAGQVSGGLVAAAVPRTIQARTFRLRGHAAIIGSAIGALAAWSVFRSDEPFQQMLRLLLVLAAISILAGTWFQLSIRGGSSSVPGTQSQAIGASVTDAFSTAPFRRYISFRVLLGLVAAVDPFLVVYGFQELGLEVEYLGLALVAYAGGHAAGHLVWPRWIARHSPRVPFQVATLLRLALLAWLLALPTLVTSTAYTDRFDDATAAMRGFAIGFALLGFAANVGNAANQRYLMDIAPRGGTAGPILAANLVAGVVAFAPFGVAWLLERYELERVLWAAVGVAFVALLASGLLVESRARIRTSPGSWRTRRQTPRTA